MKKSLLLIPLTALLLCGCGSNPSSSSVEPISTSTSSESSSSSTSESEVKSIKVDYQNCGSELPTSWDDSDTSETSRNASFTLDGSSLDIQFVGKWRISTNNKELMSKKDPVSFIRSNCDLVIKKLIVEVFSADYEVYLTNDCTGEKVTGVEATAEKSDGEAKEYEINSKTWSIKGTETYKGSQICFYSVTFII